MTVDDYRWFLKLPQWRSYSDRIKKRDNNTCQDCGTTENLQVHHIRYIYDGRQPWQYPEEYVITLCDNCHFNWHQGLKSLNGTINEMLLSGIFPNEILNKIEHGK